MEFRRITVAEYDRMVQHGILTEEDRVELIRGRLFGIPEVSDRHAACVKRSNALFHSLARGRWIVSVQDPVRCEDSKPEPDLALLRPRADFYAESTPQAADILLLIEVADSSLEFDRGEKLSLYAEAGVAEYWVVNLIDSCVEVHRGPQSNGSYADSQTVAKGGTVTFQGGDVSVDQLF